MSLVHRRERPEEGGKTRRSRRKGRPSPKVCAPPAGARQWPPQGEVAVLPKLQEVRRACSQTCLKRAPEDGHKTLRTLLCRRQEKRERPAPFPRQPHSPGRSGRTGSPDPVHLLRPCGPSMRGTPHPSPKDTEVCFSFLFEDYSQSPSVRG